MGATGPGVPPESVLLVDDDPTNLQVLLQTLKGRGYNLIVAKSGEDCLKKARLSRPQLILLDVMMPGIDGFETCRQLKADEATRDSAVIFLSALDEARDKVRGFEQGAVDFITKPFQSEEVIARVDTHLTVVRLRRALEEHNQVLEHKLKVASELLSDARRRVEAALLGESAAVRALREAIGEHARSTETLLLTGQAGAGQEAVARAVHHESDRRENAFILVNCSMLQSDHLESLWSARPDGDEADPNEKTGKLALAAGGTLYLEGVDRLPPGLQKSLGDILARLERQHDGEGGTLPDVRVIAYSQGDLIERAQQGRYDARLAELVSSRELRVPSLAERKDDIPLLVRHFVERHGRRLGSLVEGVSEGSMRRLCRYRWPGNIPELESLLERAVVTAHEPLLEIDRALLEEGLPLGHYRLLNKIGQGAMGEVWLAKHQMLARPAAVKLIRPESLDQENREGVMERFRREARATARLSSPNTVGLFDFGVSDSGAFYYVMELLRGMDLASLQKLGPLPPERVSWFLRQACRSLSEAHDAGLVHRDIKPANLFACRLGNEYDFLKVLDFGIVKSLRTEGQAKLTGTNVITGTPAYIAPECVLGTTVDARSDIYSLGCVGWCLLTGRNLFTGEVMKVLTDHVRTEPEPPSRHTEAELPAGLEETIMSCLRKEPADRPESARTLGRLLDEHEPAEPWTQERAEAWWRERMPELITGPTSPDDSTSGL